MSTKTLLSNESFYLLDESQLIKNLVGLKTAFQKRFSRVSIAYSFKTNYTPFIIKSLASHGALAEVVSEMELDLALKLGFHANEIIYNGPHKSLQSIRRAIDSAARIHIDSIDDLDTISKAIKLSRRGSSANVGIRLNFAIGDEPRSRFGIAIENSEFVTALTRVKDSPEFNLVGIHCHFPYRSLISFADRVKGISETCQKFGITPEYIDIGGGFFGPLSQEMESSLKKRVPTFDEYAEVIRRAFDEHWLHSELPELVLEPGSALVSNTLDFYTTVVSTKIVDGIGIATVAGSNQNTIPNAKKCFNLPIEVYPVDNRLIQNSGVDFMLCGYTCIEGDIMYSGFKGELKKGDVVVFKNIGSYSIVMKPPFILPSYPIFFKTCSGQIKLAKSAETFDYIFKNYNFEV